MNRIVAIHKKHISFLYSIRDFAGVLLASEDETVWLKNFTDEQLGTTVFKSIPWKKEYRLADGLLIPEGARLPVLSLASNLSWQPIQEALSIERPSYNDNFIEFTADQRLPVNLIASENPHPAVAMMVSMSDLLSAVQSVSSHRLERLEWTIVGEQALMFGTPLLSMPGKTYWQQGNHLFPAGFALELPVLLPLVDQWHNPEAGTRFLWNEAGSLLPLHRECWQQLSLASLRKTLRVNPELSKA